MGQGKENILLRQGRITLQLAGGGITRVWRNGNNRMLLFFLAQLLYPASYLIGLPIRRVGLGLFMMLIFGIAYACTFRAEERPRVRLLGCFIMVALLWTMMATFSLNFIYLAYYPVAGLATFPLRKNLLLYVACLTGTIVLIALDMSLGQPLPAHFAYALAGLVFITSTMIFMLRWHHQVRAMNEQLAVAHEEIARLSKQAERARISRDLHDVMGHQLSLISLKAQVAARVLRKTGDADRVLMEIELIERSARESLGKVRDYVANMRQPDFFEEWQSARTLLDAAGIVVTMEGVHGIKADAEVWQTFAMCLRETVTNVVRHSQASRCAIFLRQTGGVVWMAIADDGRGLVQYRDLRPDGTGCNGIAGIKARVERLAGTCHVFSQTGGPIHPFPSTWPGFQIGCCVVVSAPTSERTPHERKVML
ncbi:histidine kinase [Alicyclobacillus hesperidum URH17-3-68]|nr:histidine kinase [Alicyclobacillus hesperidum URH17-3-68]